MDSPILVLALSVVVLWCSVRIGAYIRKLGTIGEHEPEDFGIIVGAALTLLLLIIGFTFSVAISRYDQRKNYEEAEANAIGTEYIRATLLPAADTLKVRALLRSYLDQRVSFYQTRDDRELRQINSATAQLETDLWSAVQAPASAQPTAVVALAVSGMNDVLNTQADTQAAWWDRIPIEAWWLMAVIGVCCNLLIGYGARHPKAKGSLFVVLPLITALSFFLIADIDTPRAGIIRVRPDNLAALSQTLHAQ